MKILLVGGGTGGPVSPLLAVAEEIKEIKPQTQFLLVGTKTGPERGMAKAAGIAFAHISAGKLRRYFSPKNLLSPLLILKGFYESVRILRWFWPNCVFGSGSFVQVPVVWAAWVLGIPVVLHQQDVVPSLANKICQLAAEKITVSFEASLKSFASSVGLFYKKDEDKVVFTGNPVRKNLKESDPKKAKQAFNLRADMPTLLVFGGGTGAEFINQLIVKCLPELSKIVQIIHSTGYGKTAGGKTENYQAFEFIENMNDAYAAADIVMARAGLSTVSELSALGKLSIIVPMPESHQEVNALYLARKEAAIVLSQSKITAHNFPALIRKLLFNLEAQQYFKSNITAIMPKTARKKIADLILKLCE